MTTIQIKILLLKKGMSIQQLADAIGSRRDMVSQMINGLRYFPSLAPKLRSFGIRVERPVRMKRRAARKAA